MRSTRSYAREKAAEPGRAVQPVRACPTARNPHCPLSQQHSLDWLRLTVEGPACQRGLPRSSPGGPTPSPRRSAAALFGRDRCAERQLRHRATSGHGARSPSARWSKIHHRHGLCYEGLGVKPIRPAQERTESVGIIGSGAPGAVSRCGPAAPTQACRSRVTTAMTGGGRTDDLRDFRDFQTRKRRYREMKAHGAADDWVVSPFA